MHSADRNPARAEILDLAIVSNLLSSHSVSALVGLIHIKSQPRLTDYTWAIEAYEIKLNFTYREANWELFQNYLVNKLSIQCIEGNCSKSEIDVAVKHLTDTLNRVTRYDITLKRRTFRLMQIATSTRVLIKKEKSSDAVTKNPQYYSSSHSLFRRANNFGNQRAIIEHLAENFTRVGHQQHERRLEDN
jgi:hypothetical protein